MRLRNITPKSLFGRMLSIILVPIILVQIISVFIFYERHWDSVSRHMSKNLANDIGLLIESFFIFPFALIAFYLIYKNGLNDFNLSNPGLSLFLILAGPMTVIPLFLYVRGVELIGLGPTGMIFYITPTLQFIMGYFYYNESFSLVKFISFIIIWIAVIIYLKDLHETN